MNKDRLSKIFKGLAVCAGYAAALFGLLAVKAVLILLLCMALLAGGLRACLTEHASPHTRREVQEYLEWAYPGQDFTVARKYYELPNEEASLTTIRVWDCWFEDMPELVFHVESAWWGGGHFPAKAGYDLSNDVKTTLWDYYLNRYPGSLDAWTVEDGRLTMEFTSMAEAEPAAAQLQDFLDWYDAQPHALRAISAVCELGEMPLPTDPLWRMDDWFFVEHNLPEDNVVGWTNSYDHMTGRCRWILYYYYGFYNIPGPDFTAESLADFGRRTWVWSCDTTHRDYPDFITPMGEQTALSYEEWGPLLRGVGVFDRRVSFGGLYEILVRLDRAPEGTPERFAARGEDGCLYEFSYEFREPEGEEEVWYYLRDGERCALEAPILELKSGPVSQTTGLWFQYPT